MSQSEHWELPWPVSKTHPALRMREWATAGPAGRKVILQQLVNVDLFPSRNSGNIPATASNVCRERGIHSRYHKSKLVCLTKLCSTVQCATLQVLLSPAAFWSQKPFLLLCNDAFSPRQFHFKALINVTSLIVHYNLKWAFNHSYWNIDVLAACLNPSLQGAVFFAVISEDNFTNPRITKAQNCSFSANKGFPQTPAEIQAYKGLTCNEIFRPCPFLSWKWYKWAR